MDGVTTYRRWRAGNVDPGRLGRALEKGLGGDADARGNGAPQILAGSRNGVKGGSRAEIDDAGRCPVKAKSGDGIHDSIGAHDVRIIIEIANAGLDCSIDHKRFTAQSLAANLDPGTGQRRYDRSDD